MFALLDNGSRLAAAVSAIAISAVFLATAIVPAMPSLGAMA